MPRKAMRPKDSPAPQGAAGRPRWQPSAAQREQVKTLAGRGVAQKHIARILGVDVEAMVRECADELEQGRAIAIANVTGVLYANACNGDHQYFKDRQFYLINVAGFDSDKVKHALTLEDLVTGAHGSGE